MPHDPLNHIVRPLFDLLVDAAQVFAQNAQEQQLDSGQKDHRHQQRGKTAGCLVEQQLRHDRISDECQ